MSKPNETRERRNDELAQFRPKMGDRSSGSPDGRSPRGVKDEKLYYTRAQALSFFESLLQGNRMNVGLAE